MNTSSFIKRALGLLLLVLALPSLADDTPDLVLHGQLSGADIHTYRNVPFDVPNGVTRVTIDFEATGKEEHTTVDLGLLGPDGFVGQDGFRGWSGGSKRTFTVAATDATPSFLPGAIRAGRWTLLLGIPNIREHAQATYTARIWFSRSASTAWGPDVLNPPLRTQAGWYRGDLHMHDAHSDGSCLSQGTHQRVPCPLFLTAAAAASHGLDFIAITDHNTVSQLSEVRELQPYFDQMLLIPGRELTTFQGHANVFGTSLPIDFRVGSRSVPDWNTLLRNVADAHGLISINHPIRPSGEICMGCGWTPGPPIDMHLVQAIEAVNGTDALRPEFTGEPFWEAQLAKGYRITAIGGSDNHDAPDDPATSHQPKVGTPTTVVHARELSMPAILEGIRAGHVFIDLEGTRDRLLDFTASLDGKLAGMGDALDAPAGSHVDLQVTVTAPPGSHVNLLADGKQMDIATGTTIDRAAQQLHANWQSDGQRHWLRADVHGADGKLLLIGNPVYINY
jgi:hypothetical protein